MTLTKLSLELWIKTWILCLWAKIRRCTMWHKNWVLLVVGIFLLVCTPLLPAQTKDASPPQQEKTVNIDEVVKAVGEALKEAQGNNVPGFPPLKNVEINLSTVASKEGGGKFKILVLSFGGGISVEDVSTIKLKMEPPTTKQGTTDPTIAPIRYKQALAAALNLCKAAVVSAKQNLPQLITSDVEIEVAFTVKQSAEGGLSIEPVGLGDLGASIGGSGKLAKSQVHKLKLVFARGSK
jgi:hypothetical protein